MGSATVRNSHTHARIRGYARTIVSETQHRKRSSIISRFLGLGISLRPATTSLTAQGATAVSYRFEGGVPYRDCG